MRIQSRSLMALYLHLPNLSRSDEKHGGGGENMTRTIRMLMGAALLGALSWAQPAMAVQLTAAYATETNDTNHDGNYDGPNVDGTSTFLNWAINQPDGTYDRVYLAVFNTAGYSNITGAQLTWNYQANGSSDTDPTAFNINWFVGSGNLATDLQALSDSLTSGRTQATHPFGSLLVSSIPDGGSGDKTVDVQGAFGSGVAPGYVGFLFYDSSSTSSQNYNLQEGTIRLNFNGQFGAVPEPGSLALLGLGAVGVIARRRRK